MLLLVTIRRANRRLLLGLLPSCRVDYLVTQFFGFRVGETVRPYTLWFFHGRFLVVFGI